MLQLSKIERHTDQRHKDTDRRLMIILINTNPNPKTRRVRWSLSKSTLLRHVLDQNLNGHQTLQYHHQLFRL